MSSPNPLTPGNLEFDAIKANAGDSDRLGHGMREWILGLVKRWIQRLGLKLAAAACTFAYGYLHGRYDLTDETVGTIAAGAGALVAGLSEIILSYINMKTAKKALPVE